MKSLRLLLLVVCLGAALPPLPPGASSFKPSPVKPRLQSPKEASALRSAAMVRAAVVVPPMLTNWVMAFDPITNAYTTYFIRYSGATKGVIQMGTNTSVLITNVNMAVDWTLSAYSVSEGVTSRTATTIVVPGLNRVSAYNSNGAMVVSWFGQTNKTYDLQQSANLTDWSSILTRPGTNWWETWSEPAGGLKRYYRFKVN